MDLRSLSREQKMLGAAIAEVIFIISIFLKWAPGGSGKTIDSWWIALVVAIVAAALLAADALNVELPIQIGVTAIATYLASLAFFYAIVFLVAVTDPKFGLWLAFVFSLIGLVLAVSAWREDRRRLAR